MKFPLEVIGVMSGTSLDGVDLAYVRFLDEDYQFELVKTITVTFPNDLLFLLNNCRRLSNHLLIELHVEWANFVGAEINKHFIKQGLKPDYIASHGHTVFHEPSERITLQIGCLAVLRTLTKCHLIGDFRMLDVSKGGEGAPLVPAGDLFLFPEHPVCVNLGGIANVSIKNLQEDKKRNPLIKQAVIPQSRGHDGSEVVAFDVCPCNLVLNMLAQKKGLMYDKGGSIASSGIFNESLFEALNNCSYYQNLPRPSLSIELIEELFYPIIEACELSLEDILNTCCEHIAHQLKLIIPTNKKVLITGGGAYHDFLISCIKKQGLNIEIPSASIVEFKEALIFAFLAVRKIEGKINVFSSVTGASSDSVGGCLFEWGHSDEKDG